jgi:predicted aspartyl protease
MTCTLPIILALTVALVPGLAPPTSQRGAMGGAVPFSVDVGGAIVVPVFIAGTGPFRFLLDTGSTRSAISTHLAKKLRSPIMARTSVLTPAGGVTRNVTILPALQVAGSPPVSVAAMVLPDDALRRGVKVDGLLGQDVLNGRTYTIDYQRHQLVWRDGRTDHLPGYRLSLTAANGLQFVSLPNLPGLSGPARLVADSGADALVLFASADWDLPGTRMDTGMLRTAAGIHVGRRIRLDELDLGGLRLRNQSALLLPAGEATGLLGDGLLPLHLFAQVTIDAAAGVLIVAAR